MRPHAPCSFFQRVLAVGACLVAFPLGVMAADEDVNESAPKPAERISQLRGEAASLRTQAEAKFQAAESACYKRFFVTNCIDNAKTERLSVIHRARELEAEAHQIDLAERRRVAAETAKKAEDLGIGPRPTEASSPSADKDVQKPRPEIAIPSRRVTQSKTASSSANAKAAARRAEAARRDRERYDARIRELEEKKARDADGR